MYIYQRAGEAPVLDPAHHGADRLAPAAAPHLRIRRGSAAAGTTAARSQRVFHRCCGNWLGLCLPGRCGAHI